LNATAVNVCFRLELGGHVAILIDLGLDAQTVHLQGAQRRKGMPSNVRHDR
jgi:hypothetical protein